MDRTLTGIALMTFRSMPTVKPVEIVAAHKIGRRGYSIELDPLDCDVILKRLTRVAKAEAVLSDIGQPFAEVALQRRAQSCAVQVGEAAE